MTAKTGRRRRALVTIWLLAFALGCASKGPVNREVEEARSNMTPEWVAANAKVAHDDYRLTTLVRGPAFEEKINKDGDYYRVHLRSSVAKNGAESFQVYVATHLKGGWMNLHVAKDQDGIPLPVSKMARKKNCPPKEGCAYYEHFGVTISRDLLEARLRTGLDLDITGPSGGIAVVVPAVYISGFLSRIEQEQSAQAARPDRKARASYCEAKYGADDRALSFCREQARASYERVKPALDRARVDAFTIEAKRIGGCVEQYNGRLGIDWMMVEHCFSKASGRSRGPASR